MWEAISAIALIITAVAIWLQTKKASEQNMLAAITRIHKVLSHERSYRIRRYLHNDFPNYLAIVTRDTLDSQYVVNSQGVLRVDMAKVLLNPLEQGQKKLNAFNQSLINRPGPELNLNALEAVEFTLSDFDTVALPVCMGIEPAKEVAKAYKGVFEATAPIILPFVAIQKQLRGDKDYRKHYLYLLRELNINLQGLEVSEEEHVQEN